MTDLSLSEPSSSEKPFREKPFSNLSDFGFYEENEDESWVAGSGESAYFRLDMHPMLGDPIEQVMQ